MPFTAVNSLNSKRILTVNGSFKLKTGETDANKSKIRSIVPLQRDLGDFGHSLPQRAFLLI